VNRKLLFPAIAIASWPVAFGVLFLTASKPAAGERWANAHPGRGSFLAATGFLWMTGVLLFAVWKLTFIVIVPRLAAAREQRMNAARPTDSASQTDDVAPH
jgi:hypothetical protein